MELKQLQQIIYDKYYEVDSKRGLDLAYIWFMEEVGELASAIAKKDFENIREELIDVLMWLNTIANIAEVDIQGSVEDYFQDERKNSGFK